VRRRKWIRVTGKEQTDPGGNLNLDGPNSGSVYTSFSNIFIYASIRHIKQAGNSIRMNSTINKSQYCLHGVLWTLLTNR
jgi:hypothetical protein